MWDNGMHLAGIICVVPNYRNPNPTLMRVVRVFGLQGYIWEFRFLWPGSELTLFDWNWAQELDCEIIYLFIG
jgi:hypothetical protein